MEAFRAFKEKLLASFLCQYKSIRKINVKNAKLATVYWLTILFVLLYIIIYTIIIEKGYQTFDSVVGTTSVKVKGTASIGDINNYQNAAVYDAIDLVQPSQELNALFVTTSILPTIGQTRTTCNGNNDVNNCTNDSDCTSNYYSSSSQGIYTGQCGSNGRCIVKGWCPLENETDSNQLILNNVGNFTVFVKVDVAFKLYDVSQTNTLDKNNNGSPISGYNLFTIDELIGDATNGEYNTNDIASNGIIILVDSAWNCNLDYGISSCEPSFTFSRVDSQSNSITHGFNFRTAYYEANLTSRTLMKVYGVRIVFTTSGSGGKFNFGSLTVCFGAGIAYLGIASLIADIVLSNFLSESQLYEKAKIAKITPETMKALTTAPNVTELMNIQSNSVPN